MIDFLKKVATKGTVSNWQRKNSRKVPTGRMKSNKNTRKKKEMENLLWVRK